MSFGNNTRVRNVAFPAYFCLLALLTLLVLRTPKNDTWDVLEYVANAQVSQTTDFAALHSYAYQQVESHTSAANFRALTQSGEYRRKIAADAILFGQCLPYYSIRPLYIAAIRLAVALGASPVPASSLVSAVSYFVLGLVVFFWTRRYVPEWVAFAASLLLMCCYPVLLIGRLYTPDGMATCFVVLAAYILFELHKPVPGLALLLASIFVRTDCVIFVGFFVLLLVMAEDGRIRLRPVQALVLLLIAAASVLAINHFAGNYGFASLMHNQFVSESDPPNGVYAVTIGLYLRALASPIGLPAVLHGYAVPFLLIGLFAFVRRRSLMWDVMGNMAAVALLTGVAHFVLFPYFDDRLFVGEYILLAVAAVCSAMQSAKDHSSELTALKNPVAERLQTTVRMS